MKKFYNLIFLCTAGLALFSCKKEGFLGQTQTTDLTEEVVFKDSVKTTAFLTNIYTGIDFSESPRRFSNGGLDVASDEAEPYDNSSTTTIGFANGSVDANTVSADAYNTCYTNIRSVNVFLKHLPAVPFKENTKIEVKAEARFLRAWYYFILLKHYGGVSLVDDTVYNYTDKINAKRNTFKECVDYIVAECDAAAQSLPIKQEGLLFGRASAGACMALKMRTLLYAASPLFNDRTPSGDSPLGIATSEDVKKLVGYLDYKEERWRAAADAAEAIMGPGYYTLVVDNTTAPGYGFQYLFTQRVNSEYIWQYMRPDNQDLENAYLPPSRGGHGGGFPYQEFVDAFQTDAGLDITDPASGYDATKLYDHRDPRLAYSIIRDQTPYITSNSLIKVPINIYTVNGQGVGVDALYAGTKTGYYNYKMLDPAAVPNSFNSTKRCIPLIRYAEVLLSHAEATNEIEGTAKAYEDIERIRARAGLNPYKLPVGLDRDAMRKVIQHERRIELAFEGHRFWDVRRWKLGQATQTLQMTGLETQRNGSGALLGYKRLDVRKHGFKPALYLWPIPSSEIAKSSATVQNPGY